MPLEVAERCADRLGVHPYCLWPEMRDDVIASVVRVCAAEGCEETFEPLTVRRIYCSTRCRDRRAKADWARRRYRSDPVYREKRKADSAARYAAERDYVLAQRRRRTAV